MNRLYISNSKYLFITIVLFVLCGLVLTEAYYDYKNVPVDYGNSHFSKIKLPDNLSKTIIYLGDSRSGAAIIPEILNEKIPGYLAFSAGARGGNIFEMIEYVKSLNKPSGLVIICVSPASLFGSFVNDTVYVPANKINLSTPESGNLFERIDTKLSDSYLRNFKFHYGFYELKNLILYNEISHYYSWNGWESISHFGSSVRYARAYNYFGYKNYILCNSGNTGLLNKFKNKFSSCIQDLCKNQKVLLLRLPVSPEMKNLEVARFPWFDKFVSDVAESNNIKYINNFSSTFMSDAHNDWSHLSRHQAIRFSESLSDTLKLYLNR